MCRIAAPLARSAPKTRSALARQRDPATSLTIGGATSRIIGVRDSACLARRLRADLARARKPQGVPLGDCGQHRAVPGDGLVPFQAIPMARRSPIEPLEAVGVRVGGLDGLTGLAEYRNGGLFLDCGVIEPRDKRLLSCPLDATSEPVVEWRALTVTLLDRLATVVRTRLGKSVQEFPLACVLEGGSWAAGREIAFERRPDGSAPIAIISDGTLF